MNKFLLTLASLALTAGASAQTVYQTDFSTEDEFKKWTVIDANGDGTTWKFDTGGSQSHVFYTYSSSNQANDWLISPELTAAKTGKVMVNYTTYGTSYGEKMVVYTGNSTDTTAWTQRASYDKILGQRTTDYFFLDVKEGEKFRVAFRCISPADTWRFYMCAFNVKHINKAVDLKVDTIASPTSGFGLSNAETVKVRVANSGSEASSNFKVAFSVDGGTPVVESPNAALAAGESLEYTFTAKADLSTQRHNYTVKAWAIDADDINNDNDTCTVKVRCSGAAVPPYTQGFEASDDTDDIKFFNLNNDDGDWEVYRSAWYNFARTGYGCLAYNYNKENQANDWAILDPIKVEAGSYILRYWYSGSDGHTEKLGVYWGTACTPDSMTNNIEDKVVTKGEYQESFKVITFDKPQIVYLGFYCYSDKDENWLTVDDVQFYKASSEAVDLVASAISKPYDYVRTPNNKNVDFEIQNVGIKDASGKVVVYVDSVQKADVTLEVKAGEIKNLTANGVLNGLSVGKHNVKVTIVSDDDNQPDNNSVSKDIVVLGEPFMYYDFEDGKVPSDFTFYVRDKGTINKNAGDEFNQYGWGIFNLEKHDMLGEYLLAGTSWIDSVSSVDRWVVLPRITVNSEDTYLVWDANSFNQLYLETYRVKVSDGSGDPADYWYTTETEVKGESITPKTRGISLSKYKGKDIYIGFNLLSTTGEALCLDNIGVYGSAQYTGVTDVNKDKNTGFIVIDNNYVSATNAAAITVVDMSGRTVASSKAEKASISGVQAGVYVAVVKYADGTSRSTKFVKK